MSYNMYHSTGGWLRPGWTVSTNDTDIDERVITVNKIPVYRPEAVVPTPQPPKGPRVFVNSAQLTLNLADDGTDTVVTLVHDGNVLGEGLARRRKGDPWNEELGSALAAARAFRDAAERYDLITQAHLED